MADLSQIPVAILAGGLGTRLRSQVEDRPKVLAEVAGQPFLVFLLNQVAQAGFRQVILCTGYRGEMVEAAFGSSWEELQLTYSREPVPLGTGGALRLAAPLLTHDSLLVMNGDSYCEADLRAFHDFFDTKKAEAAIVLVYVPDSARFGQVQLNAQDRIQSFDEKQPRGGPGWINAGLYFIRQPLLRTIPASGSVSLEKNVFPRWLGHDFFGYRSQAPFIDIGTPKSFAQAQTVFARALPGQAQG